MTSSPGPASRPLFVVLEGIDGSGTTTQGNLLADALRRSGRTVLRTAEPSQGEVGALIRKALQHRTDGRLAPATVALLFAADRVDHCEREIGPALGRGDVVVCDRYLGSSLAFQVVDGAGEVDRVWVRTINRSILEPDVSVLIDVPIDASSHRIERRGQPRERFERDETLRQVRERYLEMFSGNAAGLGRTVIIDGHRDRELVAYDVLGVVMEVISSNDAAPRGSGGA